MTTYTKGENRVHWKDWEIGEVYYREGGTEPFVITGIGTYFVDRATYRCDYLNGATGISDTKTYLIKAEIGENIMNTQTLYQIKNEDTYGFKLATNSKGEIVFEVKSTGEVRTVDKNQLVEVMPYTVDVKFLGDNSRAYSFFSREGDLKVGDIVVSTDYKTPMVVVKTDSRKKSATKWIEGSVIFVSKVIEGE